MGNNVQLNDIRPNIYYNTDCTDDDHDRAQQATGHFEAADDGCYENNVYHYADLVEGNQVETRQADGHFGATDDNIGPEVYDYADNNDDHGHFGTTNHEDYCENYVIGSGYMDYDIVS